GRVFEAATLGEPGSPDVGLFQVATNVNDKKVSWRLGPDGGAPVTGDFLKSLLVGPDQPAKACVPVPTAQDPTAMAPVSSVSDFAGVLMQNKIAMARGISRHMQRAFANQTQVPLEMLLKIYKAYANGDAKLGDLIKTYFTTDAFSCDQGAQ